LAVARALLRNPDLLILDEATSALDTESERLIQATLDELHSETTIILIAHRLSTIESADTIVVLKQGSLIEAGTKSELIKKGDYFERVWRLQTGEN
jgi:ABC-type multidrug transport system fused ATPase/permease subunit